MTVQQLISKLTARIQSMFYYQDARGYFRDERAITKAIARYGYECHNRGWDLQPEFIYRDMSVLLSQVRSSFDRSKYLPIYLEAAVDKHIRLRAEELQAEARRVAPRVDKIVAGLKQVENARPVTATEVLGLIYRDIRKHRKSQTRPVKQKQLSLL